MFKHSLFIFLFWFILNNSIHAEDIFGKVISITDGDSITIIHNNKHIKVRLFEIDTPEKNQPYGKKAKKALSEFISNRVVKVKVVTIDFYGRTIGKIFLGNKDINKEMVKAGHAWAYVKYVKDKTLFELEKNAKDKQLGLWMLPEEERIPPWEWRRIERSKKKN